jgi:hypothetical protein
MAKDFVGVIEHIEVLHFPFAIAGFFKSFFNSLSRAHVTGTSGSGKKEDFFKHRVD